VAIADPDLATAVERAIETASACRPAVSRAFGVKVRGDETWLAGDLAAHAKGACVTEKLRHDEGTVADEPSS